MGGKSGKITRGTVSTRKRGPMSGDPNYDDANDFGPKRHLPK